ncbi:MAG: hypothetical protein ACRCY8_14365 [Dermatophilaceae bacterium]
MTSLDRSLEENLLARAAEDWVSAAEVIDLVRQSGASAPDDLRDLAVGVIARLLLTGSLIAGDLDDSTHVPWNCSAAEAVARIVERWVTYRDPRVMPGEIVWLDTTQQGQEIGETVWRREQEQP